MSPGNYTTPLSESGVTQGAVEQTERSIAAAEALFVDMIKKDPVVLQDPDLARAWYNSVRRQFGLRPDNDIDAVAYFHARAGRQTEALGSTATVLDAVSNDGEELMR